MSEPQTIGEPRAAKTSFVYRLIQHLLAGIIGFVFSFPIAFLVCLFLYIGGVWWGYVIAVFFAVIGICTLITAISPTIGGEVISFVSKLSDGFLSRICEVLEALCLPLN